MLNEPTVNKLYAMKLNGMVEALEEQQRQASMAELSFDERLAMLVERQWLWKENRALHTRLNYAKLKDKGCFEDIDFRSPRGMKRSQIEHMAASEWVKNHQNCIIIGPTGVGKTFIACALAQKACRDGYRAVYYYAPKLFRALETAHLDGRLPQLLKHIAQAALLVVDDWGLSENKVSQYRDFLEILDDRQGNGSTLITSQIPVANWHEVIGEPTVADAILDRLVHNAHKIDLKGESMRKKKDK